ncbi:MAG: hypothetical protein KDD04_11055, partial [Sinomicrobium sp.]|nr:hypothetical protein [Sinomicrobium sp.]
EIGARWVRAHWIAITDFNLKAKTVTYKDNGDDGGTAALASQLHGNNAMLKDATWDWDTWGDESGGKVPSEKAGKQEALDLTGYIVELQAGGDVGVKKDGGGCYITTACTQAKGLPDDCEELTVLRNFRDTYLADRENGASLIGTYYRYAPDIVSVIRSREDEEAILKRLYGIIKQCVDAIKKGDKEFAYTTYCTMVVRLKEEFLPETKIRVPQY